jgi:hypothetical protein
MVSLLYTSMCLFLSFFAMENKGKAANPSALHPFHIAVTEVNQNSKDKSLEISCKFFADDFEQVIEKNYKTSLDITAGKDKALFDKYIPDYINRHLMFTVDGKPSGLNYVGYQTEKESVHCFLNIANIGSVKKIDIANNLLHDFSTDQINIMHLTINGKRQSTSLNYPATKLSLQF